MRDCLRFARRDLATKQFLTLGIRVTECFRSNALEIGRERIVTTIASVQGLVNRTDTGMADRRLSAEIGAYDCYWAAV